MRTDWCTGFPEYWYRWVAWNKWERIYIGDLCKDHDISPDVPACDSTAFAKGLWERKVVGGIGIFLVASIVCWVKYPKGMWDRI
jgi:hypothetical protein